MPRLIMIDDNQMEHLIIQKLLDKCKWFPDAAHSTGGRVIMDFIRTNFNDPEALPDLILLDLNMPGYSGWDFLNEFGVIRQLLIKPISIYILTSSIDDQDRYKATFYPFVTGFFTKPLSKETLELLYLTHSLCK